ncbi:MAG: pitrilysin family protein [Planctomycetota bacterium]
MSAPLRTLTSGVKFASEHIPSAESVALTWLLPAGIAHDPENAVGLARINEELIQRGAATRDARAFADALDAAGVHISVSAGSRFTRLSVSFLPAHADDTLSLLVDMVREPRMEAQHCDAARDLALQSLASLQDEPRDRVMDTLRTTHHPPPFDRSNHGTAEGIQAVTPELAAEQWRTHAVAGGSIIAAAGAIDPDAFANSLEQRLQGVSGELAEITYSGIRPARGHHHEEADTDQVHIALAAEGPTEADDDADKARLIAAVLSGGMGARLFTEVREKRGLCYAVSANYAAAKDHGVISAYSGTTPDRAQQTLDVLLEQLAHISTPEGAPTDDEVVRAKVGLRSKLVMAGESTSARAAALARDVHALGTPRSLNERMERIEAITPDDLRDYIKANPIKVETIATIGSAKIEAGAAAGA